MRGPSRPLYAGTPIVLHCLRHEAQYVTTRGITPDGRSLSKFFAMQVKSSRFNQPWREIVFFCDPWSPKWDQFLVPKTVRTKTLQTVRNGFAGLVFGAGIRPPFLGPPFLTWFRFCPRAVEIWGTGFARFLLPYVWDSCCCGSCCCCSRWWSWLEVMRC